MVRVEGALGWCYYDAQVWVEESFSVSSSPMSCLQERQAEEGEPGVGGSPQPPLEFRHYGCRYQEVEVVGRAQKLGEEVGSKRTQVAEKGSLHRIALPGSPWLGVPWAGWPS